MTTVDDCLEIQKTENILYTPTDTSSTATTTTHTASLLTASTTSSTSSTASTLQITLTNNTSSENLYVSVTGLDTNNDNAVWLLASDGSTSYYPDNPPEDQYALSTDVAIAVGAPGASRTITVPQVAGGRIWFAQDTPLTFLLNRGTSSAALVEPSVTNASDANYATQWDFCEFTFNTSELYANISYVDFVSIPVALALTSTDGSATQTVEGLPTDGLATVCAALQAQQKVDCAGWDQLVVQVQADGVVSYLRALSPNSGITMQSALFDGYYDAYVDAVWTQYTTTTLTVATQDGSWGTVTGQVDTSTDDLTFTGVGSFAQPSTADIFNCSSGPFATTADEMGNLSARLAAALNRSTLLSATDQPDGATAAEYYQTNPTNHYARILHATNLDGRGYAFPYDDVTPTDGTDQSGAVVSGAPDVLTVYIGGGGTSTSKTKARASAIHLGERARTGRQLVGSRGHVRRSMAMPMEMETMAEKSERVVLHPAPLASKTEKRVKREVTEKTEKTEKTLTETFASKGDLESGLPAPTVPRLHARLLLLLHQMLQCLWAVLAGAAQTAWAMVPRAVARPIGRACMTVAAMPVVRAVASGVASAATSAVVRPLLVRTAVAGTLLLVYIAGLSPMLSTLVASLAGQDEHVSV